MFEPIARLLAFFYSMPVVGGSFGLAIILLTATVMIVLMPLTVRATKSTIKMQQMQPKMKELQKQYKDDKTQLNQEMLALYQEHGINPVGGCLPMVAQLPVFLILFNVLRGLSRRTSEAPFFAIANRARSEQLGEAALLDGEVFDPRYLSTDSEMYIDLHQRTEMGFLGGLFDLAAEPLDVVQDNILASLPYVLLILFVVATGFYQQRQVSARRNGGTVGMNPQQEMILKFLPVLSGVWSFVFPTGLVLYWATSNVFRIGQQAYITRAFYGQKADEDSDSDGGNGSALSLSKDEDADTEESSNGSTAAKKNQSTKTKSGNQSRSTKKDDEPASSNGSKASKSTRSSEREADDDGSDSKGERGSKSREEAWAERRRARAKSAAGQARHRESSRVTPKGTKPTGSKKKRKR